MTPVEQAQVATKKLILHLARHGDDEVADEMRDRLDVLRDPLDDADLEVLRETAVCFNLKYANPLPAVSNDFQWPSVSRDIEDRETPIR